MEKQRNYSFRRILNCNAHISCNVFFFFFFFLFFFFLISTLFSSVLVASTTTVSCLDSSRCHLFAEDELDDFQKSQERIGEEMVYEGKRKDPTLRWTRRSLGWPGSSPPRCNSKCGKCTPCKPVHVPVPPGTPVTAEYYPEAWRCKCGNKLYMP